MHISITYALDWLELWASNIHAHVTSWVVGLKEARLNLYALALVKLPLASAFSFHKMYLASILRRLFVFEFITWTIGNTMKLICRVRYQFLEGSPFDLHRLKSYQIWYSLSSKTILCIITGLAEGVWWFLMPNFVSTFI